MVCQIDNGITKLVAAAAKVDQHNQELIAEQRAKELARGWQIPALAALVIFLLGGLAGIVFGEKTDGRCAREYRISNQRVQTPALPIAATPRKNGKRAGL